MNEIILSHFSDCRVQEYFLQINDLSLKPYFFQLLQEAGKNILTFYKLRFVSCFRDTIVYTVLSFDKELLGLQLGHYDLVKSVAIIGTDETENYQEYQFGNLVKDFRYSPRTRRGKYLLLNPFKYETEYLDGFNDVFVTYKNDSYEGSGKMVNGKMVGIWNYAYRDRRGEHRHLIYDYDKDKFLKIEGNLDHAPPLITSHRFEMKKGVDISKIFSYK